MPIGIARMMIYGESIGAPIGQISEVVAAAKKRLTPGTILDGEGGFTVWGRLMGAGDSLRLGAVPIGLAHGLTLKNPVGESAVLKWSDVVTPNVAASVALSLRREMEANHGR